MLEGSKTPLNLYVEIWILQILMPPNLNFEYQQTVYILRALKDPYVGLQNPYFLELQQKNVAAGENCPYIKRHKRTSANNFFLKKVMMTHPNAQLNNLRKFYFFEMLYCV